SPRATGPRTSPQQNGGRRLLHPPPRRHDAPLPGRTRPPSPPHLPPSAGVVSERPPDPGAPRLRARPGAGLGLPPAARARAPPAPLSTAPLRPPAASPNPPPHIPRPPPGAPPPRLSHPPPRHTRGPIQEWWGLPPRVHPVPLPAGACWLNLQEGWWRLFRREAFAGQSFADAREIDRATRVATEHLNARAHPWVWGRPPPPHRHLRRRFVYYL